jgi:hypothetical protein
MSSTVKQREILRQLGAQFLPLSEFYGTSKRINDAGMDKLLSLLQANTPKVRPELLGVIGQDRLFKMLEAEGGEPKTFKYVKAQSEKGAAIPYVAEVAFAVHKCGMTGAEHCYRRLIQAANFSAQVGDNLFEGLPGGASVNEVLVDLCAGEDEPIIIFVHLTAPRVKYLDRGKSRITLDD